MNLHVKYLLIYIFFMQFLFAENIKKVNLQLSWFNQFQFAGYYIAKEKGYYKDVGLDVNILPYNFGINVVDKVNDKEVEFGIGRETIILDRLQGKNIVALFSIFQVSPLVLLSTKKSKINSIDAFLNKSIMATPGDSGEVSIKAMLMSRQLDENDFTLVKHSHNINDLVNGKIDVMSGYISKAPYELEKQKIAYNVFSPKDYGFDMYSDMLITNESMINNNIDEVIKFKHASLKGWEYAYSNIDETVDLILNKYNQQNLKREELIFEALALKRLSYIDNYPLGNIRPEKIQRMYDLYNLMGLANGKKLKDFVFYEEKLFPIKFSNEEKKYLKKYKFKNICIVPNLMPYSGMVNGKFSGFVADYMNLISKQTNINFKIIKTNSWQETLQYAQERRCDIIPSIAQSKERLKYFNFTSPYEEVAYVYVTRNDVSFISSLAQLQDKKIGLMKNTVFTEKINKMYPRIKIVETKNLNEGLDLVKRKEIYAHLGTLANSWFLIKKNFEGELKISGQLKNKMNIQMAVRNDDEILLSILDKAVKSISQEKKNLIVHKWISKDTQKEFDYEIILQLLGLFSVVLLVFTYHQFLLNKMNKKLKDEVAQKTKELQSINQCLKEKINEEVKKNLKKDRLLAQKSKMAAMGEMLENIAHQWRQPLNNITLLVHFIRDNYKNQKFTQNDVNDNVNTIMTQINYLSNVIEDFRNFAKPQQKVQRFSFSEIINKTISMMSIEFVKNRIRIIKNYDDFEIDTYENEFIQMIMNFFNNSKDEFIGNMKKDNYIFIKAKKTSTNIHILIYDNAGGIDNDILMRVFEPYFSTKDDTNGTGIGLYMTQQMIEQHMNGKIKVYNKSFFYKEVLYKGAAFKITLPLEIKPNT